MSLKNTILKDVFAFKHLAYNYISLLLGVLASFVLLLSTVVSEQVDLSTTSENLSNNIATQEDFDTVLLMDLPFAKNLKNPCSWYNGTYNGPTGSLMGPRDEFIKEFYKFISHYSRIYREDIMGMLQNVSSLNYK